jgi:hypothetical protein
MSSTARVSSSVGWEPGPIERTGMGKDFMTAPAGLRQPAA